MAFLVFQLSSHLFKHQTFNRQFQALLYPIIDVFLKPKTVFLFFLLN